MRVAVVLAAFLLFAPAASAKSYSVLRSGEHAVPVALADGRVVWLERRGNGAELVAAGEDAVPHDVFALRPVRGVNHILVVAAGGGTAIVDRTVCDSPCGRIAAEARLRVDLATGAATPLETSDCQFAFHGSVLSWSRCSGAGTVVDLADGARRALNGWVLDAAGSYAAVNDHDGKLAAVNWRTGAVLGTPQDEPFETGLDNVKIDTDGTLAWTEVDVGGVNVLTPGAAAPREVLVEHRGERSLRAAGGLIAVRDATEARDTLQVSARDGSGLRRLDAQHAGGGWDFDGTRLAWVAQPCAQATIQVWDLSTNPPPAASERCGRARLAKPAVNRKRREVTVVARCPRLPARGCAGTLAVVFSRGARRVATTETVSYRIEAGKRTTLRMVQLPSLRGRIVARVKRSPRTPVIRP